MGWTKPRKIFIGIEKKLGQSKTYVYKYPNDDISRVYSSESPEEYNKRITLKEIKSKFSNISIIHKGKEYDLEKLNAISEEISEMENNHSKELLDINVADDLDDIKIKQINDWKMKMSANSWKSRQRSLRKKGKLDLDQIDSLNRLGMLWNPKENEWEKKYLSFRTFGFCDELEIWIKEQRSLFNKNEIINENLLRLRAINFPFKVSEDEEFKLTKKSVWNLREKLSLKQSRLEKEEEKKRGVYEEKIKKKKNSKLTIKEKKEKESRKEVNSFYNRKYHYCSDSYLYKLSEKEGLDKLLQINKGESIYNGRLKDFLDIESKKFKSQGRKTPFWVRKFYSDVNDDKLSSDQIYIQLSIFITSKFSPAVRKNACLYMLKHMSNRNLNNSKSFKEINYLISTFKKEKNIDELLKLREYVNQYPLLLQLYNDKIETILRKFKYS